jgi:hypothetical protein
VPGHFAADQHTTALGLAVVGATAVPEMVLQFRFHVMALVGAAVE